MKYWFLLVAHGRMVEARDEIVKEIDFSTTRVVSAESIEDETRFCTPDGSGVGEEIEHFVILFDDWIVLSDEELLGNALHGHLEKLGISGVEFGIVNFDELSDLPMSVGEISVEVKQGQEFLAL